MIGQRFVIPWQSRHFPIPTDQESSRIKSFLSIDTASLCSQYENPLGIIRRNSNIRPAHRSPDR
jgi:hypothetical protein